MKLKKLIHQIEGLKVYGSCDIEISGLCAHSKFVAPHQLFIAKKGGMYSEEAIASGAIAVLTDLYDPFLKVTQLVHPEVDKIQAQLAARYYDFPSEHLKVVGVTGTNGKTTSTFLIKHLLDYAGLEAGLMGTVEWIIKDNHYKAHLTTADVITNHKWLREMWLSGCKTAVMEVSSHGLDQERVGEIAFEVALFTNLTPEHLDYHKDMASYAKAKEKLFTGLKSSNWAILNADSEFRPQTSAQILTYGIDRQADLRAENIELGKKKSRFIVCYAGQKKLCISPLIGRYNVYNLLGAMGVCLAMGLSLDMCLESLATFKQVRGRLERVKNALGIEIIVDFAHTEDALLRVLTTLNEVKEGRLITVFGCGGDRDSLKRPKMGAVATKLSHLTIITSDNPRTEDPQKIADEIAKGASSDANYLIELDRKLAIQKAIQAAQKGDIVLIAGRGHEQEQVFAHQVVPFDDVQVARLLCQEALV